MSSSKIRRQRISLTMGSCSSENTNLGLIPRCRRRCRTMLLTPGSVCGVTRREVRVRASVGKGKGNGGGTGPYNESAPYTLAGAQGFDWITGVAKT